MLICSLSDIYGSRTPTTLTLSTDCSGNNSIIKTTHKTTHSTHIRQGARDQFFQALSPFFCRGGAWVRGYTCSHMRARARTSRAARQGYIHIVRTSLRERPCLLFASYFPNCFLHSQSMCPGNQTSLTCKSGNCCKLELARAKTVLVLRYCCNFAAVGCL